MSYLNEIITYKNSIIKEEDIPLFKEDEKGFLAVYEIDIYERLEKKFNKFESLKELRVGLDENNNPVVDYVFDKKIPDNYIDRMAKELNLLNDKKRSLDVFIDGYLSSDKQEWRIFLYLKQALLFNNESNHICVLNKGEVTKLLNIAHSENTKNVLLVSEDEKYKKEIILFNERNKQAFSEENIGNVRRFINKKKENLAYINLLLLTRELTGEDYLRIKLRKTKGQFIVDTNNKKLKKLESFQFLDFLFKNRGYFPEINNDKKEVFFKQGSTARDIVMQLVSDYSKKRREEILEFLENQENELNIKKERECLRSINTNTHKKNINRF